MVSHSLNIFSNIIQCENTKNAQRQKSTTLAKTCKHMVSHSLNIFSNIIQCENTKRTAAEIYYPGKNLQAYGFSLTQHFMTRQRLKQTTHLFHDIKPIYRLNMRLITIAAKITTQLFITIRMFITQHDYLLIIYLTQTKYSIPPLDVWFDCLLATTVLSIHEHMTVLGHVRAIYKLST